MNALVTPAELCAALGWNRRTFSRAVAAGRVLAPSERTPGGHARWTPGDAAAAVRQAGKVPPEGWETDGQPARAA